MTGTRRSSACRSPPAHAVSRSVTFDRLPLSLAAAISWWALILRPVPVFGARFRLHLPRRAGDGEYRTLGRSRSRFDGFSRDGDGRSASSMSADSGLGIAVARRESLDCEPGPRWSLAFGDVETTRGGDRAHRWSRLPLRRFVYAPGEGVSIDAARPGRTEPNAANPHGAWAT